MSGKLTVIGLCSTTGPGSGKSTAAGAICKLYTGFSSSQTLSFATPVKAFAKILANWRWEGFTPIDQLEKYDKLPNGKPVRSLYQFVGETARSVHSDFWLTLMELELKKLESIADENGSHILVVIDDVRFLNEMDLILHWGGVVFNVVRDHAETPGKDSGDITSSEFFLPQRTLENPTQEPNQLSYQISHKVFPILLQHRGA